MNSLRQEIHSERHPRAGDVISLAQLWAIGQYRNQLELDQRQWSNLMQSYGVQSVHELHRTEAQQVIELLSSASRLRHPKRTPSGVDHY